MRSLALFCSLALPMVDSSPLRIVAFGDSTTALRNTVNEVYADRLPALLAEEGIEAEVLNRGRGGSHTGHLSDNARHRVPHALDRLGGRVRAERPDLVVVQFGINDSWVDGGGPDGASRIPLADYRRNLEAIVSTLRGDGATVLVMTPNPLGARHEGWRTERLGRYAEAAREIAKGLDVPLVDIRASMERLASERGGEIDDWLIDGSHPNDDGHALVAEALCRSIVALDNSGRLIRRTPLFEEQDLFVSGEGGVAQYRIPALAVTGKGVLVAVCDARVERPGDAPNDIDLHQRRSTDGGKSWSRVTTIVDYPGTRAAADPSLTADLETGSLWLSYVFAEEGVGLAGGQNEPGFGDDTFHHRLHRSDDDGQSWSMPIDITEAVKDPSWLAIWNAPGKGIQLADGRLLLGLSAMTAERRHQTHTIWSDDHGTSWFRGEVAGTNTNESQAVQLSGGEILLSMRRNGDRRRFLARSANGGRTWGSADPHADLEGAAGCQGCLHRYHHDGEVDESAVLIHSYPGRAGARADLTLFVSFDEGRSWSVAKRVNRGYAAYSCLATLPDGTLGLLYECNQGGGGGDRTGVQALRFARFDLDWLFTAETGR